MKPGADRQPATAQTTRPVRCWVADADWVRREAFELRLPSAVIMAEALKLYRREFGEVQPVRSSEGG